jgi:hypothetical protein
MLKKIVFSLCILAIFYIPTSYHIDGNPYGPEKFIKDSKVATASIQSFKKFSASYSLSSLATKLNTHSLKNLFPGFRKIEDRYLNWIFFNPMTPVFNWNFNPFFYISIIIFIYILSILFYYKQYKILALYFSAFIFMLASSINVHADRSLPFTWPITFLLYAYGVWFSFKLINEFLKNKTVNLIAKIILYLGIFVFAIVNIIYSYGINQSIYFNPQEFLNNHLQNTL